MIGLSQEQNILNELGPQIKRLRLARGITQQKLAERSNLSLPFVNLIENNRRSVSMETLTKLLSALDISLSDFFLPYSQTEEGLAKLIKLLQSSKEKDTYLKLFTKILELAQN